MDDPKAPSYAAMQQIPLSSSGAERETPEMFTEHRHDPRQSIELPIRLSDGSEGVVRNISPSGMYLEVRGDRPGEGTVCVEMEVPGERMTFRGLGRIVRMDHRDGVTGIAVRFDDAKLQPV
jgi:hypothetical protein